MDTTKYRSVEVISKKTQLKIEDEWFDHILIQNLFDNCDSYGFDFGDHVDKGSNHDQLILLEKKGFAFRGTRGGYHGTRELVNYCESNLDDWFD